MDLLLIPGFWLDASSWDEVLPPLVAAGHAPRALTLPGLESRDADRTDVTLEHHVEAVVAAIDAADGPVVLVGHSGGGPTAYAAAGRRPDRVARIVFVDSGPLLAGAVINDELPVVGGEIPLPGWEVFGDEELEGLDEAARAAFRARSIPQPARVASDPQPDGDAARRAIPATIIASTMPEAVLRQLMEQGHPYVAEVAQLADVEFVDLPTGHWPQFSRPVELGEAIAAAASAR